MGEDDVDELLRAADEVDRYERACVAPTQELHTCDERRPAGVKVPPLRSPDGVEGLVEVLRVVREDGTERDLFRCYPADRDLQVGHARLQLSKEFCVYADDRGVAVERFARAIGNEIARVYVSLLHSEDEVHVAIARSMELGAEASE